MKSLSTWVRLHFGMDQYIIDRISGVRSKREFALMKM